MTQIYLADEESEPFIYLMQSVNLNGCPLTNTDVTVEQYLQFAARDLEDASERGAVNALGNIKRALHQTVDTLLQGYGLLARNRRLSFPRKLELIDTAGSSRCRFSRLSTMSETSWSTTIGYRLTPEPRKRSTSSGCGYLPPGG